MSNMNENYEPMSPFYEESDEKHFQNWLNFENRFGEFGEPGFAVKSFSIKSPGFFGVETPFDVTYTTYRGEDGLLLGVHAYYYDLEGQRKPYTMAVHPDHQRQGIGTKLLMEVTRNFIAEKAHEYGYTPEEFLNLPNEERTALVVPPVLKDVKTTESAANFANRVVGVKFFDNEFVSWKQGE